MVNFELSLTGSELTADDYVVLGLATCFVKEDTDVHAVDIVEPIPSAALEALLKGITTSYRFAYATTVGAIANGNQVTLPDPFPASAQLCDEFAGRLLAATRTYQRKPSVAASIPIGTVHEGFNYSVDRKRILNSDRIVKTEDNVKQHEYTHRVL